MGPGTDSDWAGYQGRAISATIGLSDAPPPRRSEPHEDVWDAIETRERLAREHPEVLISARRAEDGSLLFEVSEPGRAAMAYDNPVTMLDALAERYPPA